MVQSRKTRRKSKGKKDKTIPEIRRALSGIEEEFDKSVSRARSAQRSVDDLTKDFIRSWKMTIGKEIPYKMAREYVELRLRKTRLSRSRTQTRRSKGSKTMKGGMPETRPGLYGSYGDFLPYQTKFMDYWRSGISEDCGVRNTFPLPQQNGGAALGTLIGAPLTGLNMRFPITSPPSVANDAAAVLNGQAILSRGPDPANIPTYKGLPMQPLPGTTVTNL